jgi:tetratricopeptide (TPR) repeat protein
MTWAWFCIVSRNIRKRSTNCAREPTSTRATPQAIASIALYFRDIRDEAARELRKAAALDPGDASAHSFLADALKNQDNREDAAAEYSKALDELRNAVTRDPDDFSAYLNLGYELMHQDKIKDAAEELRKAVKCEPGDPFAHRSLGAVLERQDNKTGEAIEEFSKAIKLNPNFARGFYDRGSTYASNEDYNRAINDYTEAIKLDPKFIDVFLRRAVAYFEKKDYEHAFADYSEVIRIDPKPAAYVTRGNAYAAKNDYTHAIADYTEAIRLEPENADAHGIQGGVLLYQGKIGEAVAEFREAVKLGAKDYRFSLGKALFDQGKSGEALAEFREAVETMRDDTYPMLWLYLARARSGAEDAKAELAANEKNLKKRDWPYPVVELFLDRRKPKAALAAATKGDDRCEAQFYVGEWRLLRGDRRAGMMNLKAAVDTCPKSFGEKSRPELESARAELKRLQQ